VEKFSTLSAGTEVRPTEVKLTSSSPLGGARDLFFTCPYTDYRKQGQIVLVFGVSCALAAAGRPAARPTDRLPKRRKIFPPFLGMLRGKRKRGKFDRVLQREPKRAPLG
jgi:hypothetical protein